MEKENKVQLKDKPTLSGLKLILQCILICQGAVFTGYILGSYSFVQPTMQYVLDDDSSYITGLCNALVTIGIAFGSLSSNYLLNQKLKKRRYFFIMADILGFLSSILQIFASLPTLFIGRFIGGITAGFNFLICPLYIKEYVPQEWLGTSITIYSNSVNAGVMLSYIVGFSLSVDVEQNTPYIYRLNLVFPIIFCFLRIFYMKFIKRFDTPAYYLEFESEDLAKQALLLTHTSQEVDEQIQQQKLIIQNAQQTKVALINLFSKKYRKRLAMAIFSSSSEAITGLMIFTAYSWMIYSTVVGQKTSLALSVSQIGVQMIGLLFLGKFINKFGRKQIMVSALIGNLIAMIGLTFSQYMIQENQSSNFYTFLTIFCLQLYYACLGLGISCISFIIVVDLIPQSGISIANGFMALFNSIYSFGFPVLIETIPIWKALGILCICDVLLILIFVFWVVETKGLSEQQIDQIFNKKK